MISREADGSLRYHTGAQSINMFQSFKHANDCGRDPLRRKQTESRATDHWSLILGFVFGSRAWLALQDWFASNTSTRFSWWESKIITGCYKSDDSKRGFFWMLLNPRWASDRMSPLEDTDLLLVQQQHLRCFIVGSLSVSSSYFVCKTLTSNKS